MAVTVTQIVGNKWLFTFTSTNTVEIKGTIVELSAVGGTATVDNDVTAIEVANVTTGVTTGRIALDYPTLYGNAGLDMTAGTGYLVVDLMDSGA